MAISLQKGGNVNLSKTDPNLNNVLIGLGWSSRAQFPFTRQQLASLTGLCVETVIRVVKKMEKEKTVRIQNGKIFY